MAKKSNEEWAVSGAEMEALTALCDTFLPSVDLTETSTHHSVLHFFHTSASMAGTPHHVGVFVGGKIKHPKLYLARLALWLLSTKIGTLLLCGRQSISLTFPFLHTFSSLPLNKREHVLHSLQNSSFPILRLFFTALKIFTLFIFFTQVNERKENPSWKAIGYPGADQTGNQEEEDDEEVLFGPLHKGIVNFTQLQKEAALLKLQNLGIPVSLNPSLTLSCDAVVLGSGSGGGLMAGVLAKAGYKVIVIEKGKYLARNNLSLVEGEALDQMYLGHGLMGTDNMDVLMVAGSTVGGGSTINWSASIRTPPRVLKEWSEEHQLELFTSKAYEHALDVVSEKMGVQSEYDREGFNNMVLRKGCRKLGYIVEDVPRNAPSDHYCGWCCLGCKDGKKKGTSETWLVDLVDSGNCAILAECEAVKVITDRKRAIGVAFEFQGKGGKEMGIVESRVTVAACGAICTPGLLKRSGLKNPNIGRNLHLHPVVMAWGYFPDQAKAWPEVDKRSYEGGIMTAMSQVGSDWAESGYGTIIQTPSLHPGLFSALMPWNSGRDIKSRMLRFSRTAHVYALGRDRGTGVITSETDVSYKLDDTDHENLAQGMERVLRILAAAGAEEIGTHHTNGRVLRVKEADQEEFERFVKEESQRPLKGLSTPICSAHQMGTCRMGADPTHSAVNPKGETWEVEGLFVADTSVFPTALGVNPMITVQATAYCIAQSVLEVLGGEE